MKRAATIGACLYTSRSKGEDQYPVVLRITFERNRKYYTLAVKEKSLYLTKLEFTKVMDLNQNVRGDLKAARAVIKKETQRAEVVRDSLTVFSFAAFDMKFSGKVKKGDVAGTYQLLIDKLMGDKPQRVSTASTYETSKKSLQKYFGTKHNKDAILFSDLTVTTLKNYRDYLRNDGCTDATAGIYLRCLRAVYKKAIENGNARAEDYPFGKEENDKFEIPTSQGRNIALTLEEIAKIYRYDPSGIKDEGYRKNREFARDMFIFSYLVNGINIKDISRLKYRNIKDGFISFMRAKTINTSKRKRLIICQVTDDIQKIIDRWGTKPVQPDRYIFPMLYEKPVKLRKPRKLSADQLERLLVQNATGTINDHLKIIAKDCGITKPVTTYTARHSFASIGNVEGMPLSYISADLGHTSLQQTQAYLDNIETDKTREIRRRMADFTGN